MTYGEAGFFNPGILCAQWTWGRQFLLHQCSQAPPNQEHVSSLGAQDEGGRFKLRKRGGSSIRKMRDKEYA